MKARILLFVLSGLVLASLLTACEKNLILHECAVFDGFEIISEDDYDCYYLDVYLYKGGTYTVTNHCLMDLVFMAFDCAGETLCDYTDTCMADFGANAKYLYSVQPE